METALIPPAEFWYIFLLIPVLGVSVFTFIISKRLAPLVLSRTDPRTDRIVTRTFNMLKYALGQYRQPRYMLAGILHITIFSGFMIISLHSVTLVMTGIKEGFTLPFMGGLPGEIYAVLKDIIATAVFAAVVVALVRRVVFKPQRYAVPPRYGKENRFEALFVLCMIAGLMISDAFYEGSLFAARAKGEAGFIFPFSLTWIAKNLMDASSASTLQGTHMVSFLVHELIFFSFLIFLPLGKHFHVITSFPNVFFMKLERGTVKPVEWDVKEEDLDDIESFGVKKFEDFTWKHILDFYSCTDCGRCSDHCPATAAGRPLSPRFISIKCRTYSFNHYPLTGEFRKGESLIPATLEEDEIWSCTTCGACEQECPLFIEYIDKIVDLRRGMVDEGMVPQSLQKPLNAMARRGNPYGKTEKKRGHWTKALSREENLDIKVLGKNRAEILYFVDSVTSYDDRIQEIGRATARVLTHTGVDFGILGKTEKDSGHEIRRFGEEMLFLDLKEKNTGAILDSGVAGIVVNDPHAMNALQKDYQGLPPVEHVSLLAERKIREGVLKFNPVENRDDVYVYHDPCYLGRHNLIYEAPRFVIDAIPGIHRVEMERCRDRALCCGGGGLMLFYEPDEEQRIGQIRVKMAEQAGASVIVTACPYCMVNIEDAIKTSGLENQIRAVDLMELVAGHMV
ncbi:MAG: (Fe-S)-binding protein [Desulfobacterales bacterium]|nr:(Fe-S)-binding protein [Desulfobacterales bacterium]